MMLPAIAVRRLNMVQFLSNERRYPGFDKDHWPSMADPTWATDVYKFYGTPYRQDSSADTLSEREPDPRIQ